MYVCVSMNVKVVVTTWIGTSFRSLWVHVHAGVLCSPSAARLWFISCWILYIFLVLHISSNRLVLVKTSISPSLSLHLGCLFLFLHSLLLSPSPSLFLIGCRIPSFHPSMAPGQWGDRIGFLLDKALPLVVVETMRWGRLLPSHTIIRSRNALKIQLVLEYL